LNWKRVLFLTCMACTCYGLGVRRGYLIHEQIEQAEGFLRILWAVLGAQ